MKERVRYLNKSIARCRFISLSFLPMMTIQWIIVSFSPDPIIIGCALFVTDTGIDTLIEHYKMEKFHAEFLSSLPKEWLP